MQTLEHLDDATLQDRILESSFDEKSSVGIVPFFATERAPTARAVFFITDAPHSAVIFVPDRASLVRFVPPAPKHLLVLVC